MVIQGWLSSSPRQIRIWIVWHGPGGASSDLGLLTNWGAEDDPGAKMNTKQMVHRNSNRKRQGEEA